VIGQLAWFLRLLRAFVRREAVALSAYRAAFGARLLGSVLAAMGLIFFARFVGASANPHLTAYGGNYLGFILIGVVATEFQQVGVNRLANRIRGAQMLGYFEAEVATPAPVWMVLAAAPVYEFGTAAARSTLYLVVATSLLGLKLAHVNGAALVLTVGLMLAAFIGLGLLTAGSTMLVRRTNPVAAVLGSLSFFLSGVMYPITVLPPWLRTVGKLLPLTSALEALRGTLLVGASAGALRGPLAALGLFALVLIPAGTITFAYALHRARIDGSLTHY
jgi:ABC-2 type transport system permease protein